MATTKRTSKREDLAATLDDRMKEYLPEMIQLICGGRQPSYAEGAESPAGVELVTLIRAEAKLPIELAACDDDDAESLAAWRAEREALSYCAKSAAKVRDKLAHDPRIRSRPAVGEVI